jgi:hypothetical protein
VWGGTCTCAVRRGRWAAVCEAAAQNRAGGGAWRTRPRSIWAVVAGKQYLLRRDGHMYRVGENLIVHISVQTACCSATASPPPPPPPSELNQRQRPEEPRSRALKSSFFACWQRQQQAPHGRDHWLVKPKGELPQRNGLAQSLGYNEAARNERSPCSSASIFLVEPQTPSSLVSGSGTSHLVLPMLAGMLLTNGRTYNKEASTYTGPEAHVQAPSEAC